MPKLVTHLANRAINVAVSKSLDSLERKGKLGNEPLEVRKAIEGDVVDFVASEIRKEKSDWGMLMLSLSVIIVSQPAYRAASQSVSFENLWALAGIVFTPKVRERFWEPLCGEDLQDYVACRQRHPGTLAKWWIRLCFFLRTVLRVMQVLWYVGLGKLLYVLGAAGYLLFKSSK